MKTHEIPEGMSRSITGRTSVVRRLAGFVAVGMATLLIAPGSTMAGADDLPDGAIELSDGTRLLLDDCAVPVIVGAAVTAAVANGPLDATDGSNPLGFPTIPTDGVLLTPHLGASVQVTFSESSARYLPYDVRGPGQICGSFSHGFYELDEPIEDYHLNSTGLTAHVVQYRVEGDSTDDIDLVDLDPTAIEFLERTLTWSLPGQPTIDAAAAGTVDFIDGASGGVGFGDGATGPTTTFFQGDGSGGVINYSSPLFAGNWDPDPLDPVVGDDPFLVVVSPLPVAVSAHGTTARAPDPAQVVSTETTGTLPFLTFSSIRDAADSIDPFLRDLVFGTSSEAIADGESSDAADSTETESSNDTAAGTDAVAADPTDTGADAAADPTGDADIADATGDGSDGEGVEAAAENVESATGGTPTGSPELDADAADSSPDDRSAEPGPDDAGQAEQTDTATEDPAIEATGTDGAGEGDDGSTIIVFIAIAVGVGAAVLVGVMVRRRRSDEIDWEQVKQSDLDGRQRELWDDIVASIVEAAEADGHSADDDGFLTFTAEEYRHRMLHVDVDPVDRELLSDTRVEYAMSGDRIVDIETKGGRWYRYIDQDDLVKINRTTHEITTVSPEQGEAIDVSDGTRPGAN